MRTHIEFASSDFSAYPNEQEQINAGRFGKRLAEFLARGLPAYGFSVRGVCPEDWGWKVELENESFPLWIGCGNYEEFENGFLCFIEPSKPFVKKWLSKIDTFSTVDKLASALEAVLKDSGRISKLRWWSDEEARI